MSANQISITSLNPNAVAVGSGKFTLTIIGQNFTRGSIVIWNRSPRRPVFVSSSVLTLEIEAAQLVNLEAAVVKVAAAPDSEPSNELKCLIYTQLGPGPETPVIAGIDPRSVKAEAAAAVALQDGLELTVTGANFKENSKVRFNALDLRPTFVSPSLLKCLIPADQLKNPGLKSVAVVNPNNLEEFNRGFTTRSLILACTGGMVIKNAASLDVNEVAKDSIAFADGLRVATADGDDSVFPLDQLRVAGTSIAVADQVGRTADALIHKTSKTDKRVKFLVPKKGIFNGSMSVTLTNGDGVESCDDVELVRVGPGLFSANGSGSGLAQGDIERVTPAGSTFAPLTNPIDLSLVGPQNKVFLRLNATGVRSAGLVTASITGFPSLMAHVSDHPNGLSDTQFVGMDRVTVELPQRPLMGNVPVDVTIFANFKPSNTVTIIIA